jgi:hypothetical protein
MKGSKPRSQTPSLSTEAIRSAVSARLKRYAGLNVLEQFAMFMGTAQLLELCLKGLLHRLYKIDLESMERWTLGQVARTLKEHGLREDFTTLLDSVVEYRNHIAHSLLANELLLRSLLGGRITRPRTRELDHGIYELEQLCFLYEWTERYKAWGDLAA